MADISKCEGINCEVKNQCYRYKADAGCRQSWLVQEADHNGSKGDKCDMYWPEYSSTQEVQHDNDDQRCAK